MTLFQPLPTPTSFSASSGSSYSLGEFPVFMDGKPKTGVIELVSNPADIDQKAAQKVLIESFIGEYSKYLIPSEIGEGVTSWRDGDFSVQKYYENYFHTEFQEFVHGKLDFWLEAKIAGKLVGWATFQREKANDAYMNLLVVLPEYQGLGVGGRLTHALRDLGIMPDLEAIHLLLRKKNEGGRTFYSKLGFSLDKDYQRDNFVDLSLLEGWTWRKHD